MKLFYLQNLLPIGHFRLYFRLYFRWWLLDKKLISPKEAVLISVGCFLCLFAADDVIVYKQQPFSVMRFILDSKLLFRDPRTILNGPTRIQNPGFFSMNPVLHMIYSITISFFRSQTFSKIIPNFQLLLTATRWCTCRSTPNSPTQHILSWVHHSELWVQYEQINIDFVN